MIEKYIAIDHEGDIEYFDTEEEAKTWAEVALDYCRDNAGDGWCEEVENICVAKIVFKIEETMRRPRTEEDYCISPSCDEVVDYGLSRAT
jgi:hypothetical protein